MRINSQSAYLLHSRPYRETSLLVDLFTLEFGRVSAICRGAKKYQGLLQPFRLLLVSWSGKNELKTLYDIEPQVITNQLIGHQLFSGLYINELVTRLLGRNDPHTELFSFYDMTLNNLSSNDIEVCLRQFEKYLLAALGYGINFTHDALGKKPITSDLYYRYEADIGFIPIDQVVQPIVEDYFSGKVILAIAANDYATKENKKKAKQLMRLAIQPHLNGKPLQSRTLFL